MKLDLENSEMYLIEQDELLNDVQNLHGEVWIGELINLNMGTVYLKNKDKEYKIDFNQSPIYNRVYANKNCDSNLVGYKKFFNHISNSPLIDKLRKQANEAADDLTLLHFAIVTRNSIIDIVSTNHPVISEVDCQIMGDKKWKV